jgi:hypothetical protein
VAGLVDRLRYIDRVECQSLTGYGVFTGITGTMSLEGSDVCTIVDRFGHYQGLFGVFPLNKTTGYVWLVATDWVYEHPMTFLKGSQKVVSIWKEKYPVLVGLVSEPNIVSQKWLKWLGFNIRQETRTFFSNLKFHIFSNHVASPTTSSTSGN